MIGEKTYLYWIYYMKENDKYKIYAYTDQKELSTLFEEFRDMSKFYIKKIKLNREDVNNLAELYQPLYLMEKELTYRKFNKVGKIKMAITMMENLTLQNHISKIHIDLLLGNVSFNIDPNLLKPKIRDALTVLGYTELYNYIYEESDKPEYIIDELNVFIEYYGKTLRG